jgi:hypothetical protein
MDGYSTNLTHNYNFWVILTTLLHNIFFSPYSYHSLFMITNAVLNGVYWNIPYNSM